MAQLGATTAKSNKASHPPPNYKKELELHSALRSATPTHVSQKVSTRSLSYLIIHQFWGIYEKLKPNQTIVPTHHSKSSSQPNPSSTATLQTRLNGLLQSLLIRFSTLLLSLFAQSSLSVVLFLETLLFDEVHDDFVFIRGS